MRTEPILLVERDMPQPETYSLACGLVSVYSMRSPGKPTPNEDAAAVLPLTDRAAVLAVADGMGGGPSGEEASAIAVRALTAALRSSEPFDPQQLRFAILNGIEQANLAVQRLGSGAATTLAVVEVCERTIRPYHVGDSLILVVGNRGKLKLQNVPHSPVGYAVEAGLLDESEAMHHDDRHLVSNLVGTPNMRIELGAPLELALRDTLILASDGLSDNLHTEEIIERIRKGRLGRCARQLARQATERMLRPVTAMPSKPDDLTFVAFRLASRPRAAPPATDAGRRSLPQTTDGA